VNDEQPVKAVARLRGRVRVPGDKSTSHRALLISALASGESVIDGLSPGADVRATSRIVAQLGAAVHAQGARVHVLGPEEGLHPSATALDCGNSGTTMRLLAGLVSGVEGAHELVGDASLSARPMDRVAVPLRAMGALVEGAGERVTAPLRVHGRAKLRALDYRVPTASAQVKSCILFAGLHADAPSTVREDVRTRRTTEEMFRASGIAIDSVDVADGRVVTLQPGRPLATSWVVPGDPSQAAFFSVLGAIHEDADLTIVDVDATPERVGFVDVLERMGAQLSIEHRDARLSLRARSSALVGVEVFSSEIPSVDEVPILAVAAAAARGVSAFRDMGELRLKESDRFEGAMTLVRVLGCRAWAEGDDFFVEGLSSARLFAAFEIDAHLDHRMVMAAAVAGSAGQGCVIGGATTVSSSYPGFFADLAALS
jgi:3-phosphoshikimate 1-carboxyvinyltransferase